MKAKELKRKFWRNLIIEAVNRYRSPMESDGSQIDIMESLIDFLIESEQAKQALRDKGYGWQGLSLLKIIEQVPPA